MNGEIFPLILQFAGGFVAGLVLGFVHFRSLHRVTEGYLEGRVLMAVGLQFARLALLGVALYLLARVGALCLLGGGLGMVIARRLVMRRLREEAP